MSEIKVFDNKLRRLHRDRASKIINRHDVLIKEATRRLIERLDEEIKHHFRTVLDIGSRSTSLLASEKKFNPELLVTSDISHEMLKNMNSPSVCLDEELLPFRPESFDLITSILNLNWVNDLPGCLIQIKNLLRARGLFLGSMLGGQTLWELRMVLTDVELSMHGGISPRMSPSIDIKDAGALLQRAGFKLPVVDTDKIVFLYPDLQTLVKDLRGMGETNALLKRSNVPLTKQTVALLEERYCEMFKNEEGLIPATFEIITMTGWKS